MIDALFTIQILALWRLWDGQAPKPEGFWPDRLVYFDKKGKLQWRGYTTLRNIVGLLLGAWAGYQINGEYSGCIIGMASVGILIPGWTKWESPLWMALRYGIPAAGVALAAFWYMGSGIFQSLSYPLIFALSGVSYVLWGKAKKLPIQPNQAFEMSAGAAAGLVVLL